MLRLRTSPLPLTSLHLAAHREPGPGARPDPAQSTCLAAGHACRRATADHVRPGLRPATLDRASYAGSRRDLACSPLQRERSAPAQLRRVADGLAGTFPAVAELLLDAEADLLVHFTFPEAHRRQIRSTDESVKRPSVDSGVGRG